MQYKAMWKRMIRGRFRLKQLLKAYFIPPGVLVGIRIAINYLRGRKSKSKTKSQFPYCWSGEDFLPHTDCDVLSDDGNKGLLCVTKSFETKTVVSLESSSFLKISGHGNDTIAITLSLTPKLIEESVSDLQVFLDDERVYVISGTLSFDKWYNLRIPISELGSKNKILSFEWVGGQICSTKPQLEQRAGSGSKPNHSRREKKNNVIVIILDGLSPSLIGCSNSRLDSESSTPYIDRFFEDGRVYKNAYSQSEYTMPSSATMMTGLYPIQHGVFTHDQCQRKLPRDIPTIAELLRSAGYRTFACSEANRFIPPYGHSRGFEGFIYRWIYDRYHTSVDMINRCIQFLEAHQREPMFCFMHFMGTHPPYETPNYFAETMLQDTRWSNPGALYNNFKMHRDASDSEKLLVGAQKAALKGTDLMLCTLFAYLTHSKLGESTNVILTADGQEFKKRVPLLTNERTRVPLLVRGPEISSGHFNELVEACVNIYPTIVQMAGVENPAHLPGSSVLSQPGSSENLCISESLFRRQAEIAIRSQALTYYSQYQFDPLLGKVNFEKQLGEWLFSRNELTGQEDTSNNLVVSKSRVLSERQHYVKAHFDGLPRYFSNDSIIDETRSYPE